MILHKTSPLILAGGLAALLQSQAPAATKPNVVLIYTDDQPKSQFGCYGGQKTPNIDRLAAEGVRFDRFYVSTGLCAPSRYAMHTGRYASAAPATLREFPAGTTAAPVQQIGNEESRPAESFALPATLKATGYATGLVGKWHQGFMGTREIFKKSDDALPMDDPKIQKMLLHNFRLSQEAAYAAGYDYAEALYHDNLQMLNFPASARYHNQEWVTWKALEFIEANKDRPFFLNISPTLVHYPPEAESLTADRRITAIGLVDIPEGIQPSREDVLRRAQEQGLTKKFQAAAIWLDDAVGAVVQKLENLGLLENTIILVISDNGTQGKWSCYEGGCNTGCIVSWKGKIQPGQISQALFQNVDIAPTLFELCGVNPAPETELFGYSLANHLLKGNAGPRKAALLEFGYQRAVVAEDGMKYLAVRFPEELQAKVAAGTPLDLQGKPSKGKHKVVADELFNLKNDPSEQKNLADHPGQEQTLQRMKKLLAETLAPLPHAFGEFK